MHCTLLVPQLLKGFGTATPGPSYLATLLARGDATELEATGADGWLCKRFGVHRQQDWPVAALTLPIDGGDPGSGYWLRCDPVHLQVHRNRMVLSAAEMPTAVEAAALFAALNAHFCGEGLLFHAGSSGRGYLRCAAPPDLATCPLADVDGGAIDACMPTGTDSGRWRRTLNEAQMILHAHPVNTARETRGLPAFNSLWLWGGGSAPPAAATARVHVWADDALARALAVRSALPDAPLPAHASAVCATGDDALVVLNAPRDAVSGAAIEHDWMAPCHAALRARHLRSLCIIATAAQRVRRFDITAAHLWRWWRRTPDIGRHD